MDHESAMKQIKSLRNNPEEKKNLTTSEGILNKININKVFRIKRAGKSGLKWKIPPKTASTQKIQLKAKNLEN